MFVCVVKHSVPSFCRGTLDIALVHRVSPSEVYVSTRREVNDIHLNKSMNMHFPISYKEQKCVANDFKSVCTTEFDNCAGYIDGLLIWTFNPHEKDAVVSEVEVKTFTAKRKILV